MKIHRNLNELPEFVNPVITTGSFDGVHQGHQRIISIITSLAKKIKGESILITFHPHPRVIVQSEPEIKLLTTLPEKIEILSKGELDHLVIVPFNREFSNSSADYYIKNFLVRYFTPKIIALGYNHKFGKNRIGDIELLKTYASVYQYELEVIDEQQIADLHLSSSDIRKALFSGGISKANQLLGYRYFLKGNVIKGDQIGRTIGFPTANLSINIKEKLIPKTGVYACWVVHRSKTYKGMLYIGYRPVLDKDQLSIEVNIFDFNENIYGDILKVELVKFIREDEKLADLQALKSKLEEDKLKSLSLLDN